MALANGRDGLGGRVCGREYESGPAPPAPGAQEINEDDGGRGDTGDVVVADVGGAAYQSASVSASPSE